MNNKTENLYLDLLESLAKKFDWDRMKISELLHDMELQGIITEIYDTAYSEGYDTCEEEIDYEW